MSRLQKVIVELFTIFFILGTGPSGYTLQWRTLEAGTKNVTQAALEARSGSNVMKSENVVCVPVNYTGSFAYYFDDFSYTYYVNWVTRVLYLLSPSHGSRQTLGVYDTISIFHLSTHAQSSLYSLYPCMMHGQKLSSNGSGVSYPGFSYLDWVAFRGPLVAGGLASEQRVPGFDHFTVPVYCQPLNFVRAFNSTPFVFIGLGHRFHNQDQLDLHSDAYWIGSVSKIGVTICVDTNEKQYHQAVYSKWTAFESDKSLLPVAIRNNIPTDFQFGSESPRAAADSSVVAVCIDKPFEKPFDLVPKVFGTVKYDSASVTKNLALQLWFETITTTGFRVCIAKKSWETRDLTKALPSINWMAFHEKGLYDLETERMRSSMYLKLGARNVDGAKYKRDSHRSDALANAFEKWVAFLAGVSVEDLRFEYIQYNKNSNSVVMYFAIHGFRQNNTPRNEEDAAINVINKLLNYPKSSYTDAEMFVTEYLKPLPNQNMTISGEYQRNCAVSPFNWTDGCSQRTCGGSGGTLRAIRKITGSPTNNGRACPDLIATWPCNYEPCITSAQWGAWNAGGQSLFTSGGSGSSAATIIIVIVVILAIIAFGVSYFIFYRRKGSDQEAMLGAPKPKLTA